MRIDPESRPAISVLVPAFDDEAHLGEALASLAAQTFDDFEAIVADDASRDGTAALAESWARRDPRFRLVRNPANLGMTENWNRALGEASGPCLFKLDADDALEPETLARLHAALVSEPEARFAACRTVECDEALRPLRPFHGERALLDAALDPARDHSLAGWRWFELSFDDRQLWHSSAQLHRTEGLRALGGWDATWSCASDTDLILRSLATDRRVLHLGHVGVSYRRRADSVSDRSAREGWKVVESVLVGLRALESAGRERVRASARLRRNWYRLWSAARALGAGPEPWRSMPDRVRGKLEPAYRALRRPPAAVRCEGWLRDRLWQARQKLRPAAGSPA